MAQFCAIILRRLILYRYNGLVYTWGSSSHGQLGHGNKRTQLQPKLCEALEAECRERSSTARLLGCAPILLELGLPQLKCIIQAQVIAYYNRHTPPQARASSQSRPRRVAVTH